MKKAFKKKIEDLQTYFGVTTSFDFIEKNIKIGKKNAYVLMIDGFVKDFVASNTLNRLMDLPPDTKIDINQLLLTNLGYIEAELSTDFKQQEIMLLSGAMLVFVEDEESVFIIDAREYPVRGVDEPDLEKVTRGARDGFVETLVFNTTLIRRRIRDTRLRFEIKHIGNSSKTDVVVSYMEGIADPKYVESIKKELDNINVESLLMSEKTLAEILTPKQWYNPLPKVRYTERPDVASAHLLEGHVLIIVDNSPNILILPTTLFHFIQHPEDYYQQPLVGNYMRLIRFGAIIIAYLLIPIWYLLMMYAHLLPDSIEFMLPNDDGNLSFFLQLLFLDIGIDLLRLSSIHTPSTLSTTMGIVSGLILSNLAIETGWLSPEAIFAIAIVAICSFAIPSIELSMSITIFRLFVFILTALFGLIGFIIGIGVVFGITLTTKNNSKTKYLYPLIPFDWEKLKRIFIRFPFQNK